MNLHLLRCADQRRRREANDFMSSRFAYVHWCHWNDCLFAFKNKKHETCLRHVTRHIAENKSHQCMWGRCHESFDSHEALAYHLSKKHSVPTEWTTLTNVRYCFEHNRWYRGNHVWDVHLRKTHLPELNDFCGLIRQGGAILVAAHCLFCIGNTTASLLDRFLQFSDVCVLHRHMKAHLVDAVYPLECPHTSCSTSLHTENLFWEHAVSVHGIPPLHAAQITGKRKSPCEDDPQPG